MIAPVGADSFREAVRWGAEVYHALKSVLRARASPPAWATRAASPRPAGTRAALDLIATAVEKAGYTLGRDIVLALDVAATEFHDGGVYSYEGRKLSSAEMTAAYTELVDAYPLVSIEDPLSEDDWDGWVELTSALGGRVQIVGDDLFVTNPERLETASTAAPRTRCW
jgi:enolase